MGIKRQCAKNKVNFNRNSRMARKSKSQGKSKVVVEETGRGGTESLTRASKKNHNEWRGVPLGSFGNPLDEG